MSVVRLGDVDSSGRRSPVPTGESLDMDCDSVIIAIGRGPNTFLQRNSGLEAGAKGAIKIDDHCMTSLRGVFAAGDVASGESLVVKAMAGGSEAAQRIHVYLMMVGDEHASLYDYYLTRRTSGRYYREMMDGKEELPPPS